MEIRRRELLTLSFGTRGSRREARSSHPTGRAPGAKRSARFPDVQLKTPDGTPVRFYEDLVQDALVLLHFPDPLWSGQASVSRNLTRVCELLEGLDSRCRLIAISTEDSGEKHEREGPIELTGSPDAVASLRRALGVGGESLGVEGGDSEFAGILTLGNDRSERWGAFPALLDATDIVERVARFARS